MRNYLFLILMLSVSGIFAQDSTKIKIPSIPAREDLIILNFSSDNWSGLPSDVDAKPLRSRGFSFLLMADKMNHSGNFGVGAGLGFLSHNVHTNAFITDTGSASQLTIIPDSVDSKVNKLSTNFITAALELRLRSNENKKGERFKLSIGFIAGVLVQSHTKFENPDGKFKTYAIEHLNKFLYGLEGRLGYNNVAFYGYYSFADLFKKGEGPVLSPYSLGISVTM